MNVEELEDNLEGVCAEVANLGDKLQLIPRPESRVTFTGSISACDETSGASKKFDIRPKMKIPVQF